MLFWKTKPFAFYMSSSSVNVNVTIQDTSKYCADKPFNNIWLPSRSNFWNRLSQNNWNQRGIRGTKSCSVCPYALFKCTILLHFRDFFCVKMEKLQLNTNCCGSNQAVFIAVLKRFLLCIRLTCSAFLQFIVTTLFILLSIIKLILHYL